MAQWLYDFLNSDFGFYSVMIAAAIMFVALGYSKYQNRRSQWKEVGIRDGYRYLQHIKYPKRRIWEQVYPLPLRRDWINHKTDELN